MFRRRGTLLILLSLSGLLGGWWLCSRNEPRSASATRETPRASRLTAPPALTSATEPKLDGPATSPAPRHAFQFPGSRVLEERTLSPDASGLITKLQLLQTRGQYPLVRVIETHREGNADFTERAAMVADHVTVKLSAGRQPDELIAWARTHGLTLRRTVGAGDLYLLQLAQPDLAGFDALLQRLNADPARPIDYAEPDYLRFAASVPNDTRFAEQWALHNTGQTGGTPDADVDAPEAWDISRGSASVIVAVIDSGMDLTHPDLVSNLWSNPGEAKDGIDNDGNGYIDDVNGWNFIDYPAQPPNDTEGHGTHCAGVLGAVGDNSLGVSGICPLVTLMPLKAIANDGSIAVSSEVAALNYARAKGAKICSMSFGGPGPASSSEKNAVLAAYNAGMLLVCAAGNDAENIDAHPSYPASFSYNNIISVAASGHSDARIAFSNYGPVGVDLAAPGVGILSTLPGGTYGYESGTSMSTPLVAGACALLAASQPSLNYAAIKSAILSACDPVAAWQGKTRTAGRLNVARALKIGNGPFIELTSVKFSDGRSYGANGNSDGVINAGEDITLTLTVRNSGPVIATGVSTTAAITTGNSAVSIAKGSKTWGNMTSKALLTNTTTPLVLRMATGIATETPFTVQFTHADTAGHTWIEEKTFTIAGTTTIAGRVSTLTGDKAIASATVNYYGPLTGKVSTGKDGRYSIKLPNGIYTITAVATGYQTSPAQTITIPPQPADVNFQLGRGQLVVAPTSIAVTQPEESTTTKTLTLTNKGDLPLTITVENSSLGNAINTAYYSKLSYGDAMRQAAATYAPLPYQEGFEGALSLSPARYYEQWTEDDGYYIYTYVIDFFVGSYSVVSNTSAVGSRSLYYREQLGAGFDNGMHRRFPNGTQPHYVSFRVRPGSSVSATGCFSLEDGVYDSTRHHWNWEPIIDFKAVEGAKFDTNGTAGGDTSVSYTPNQWHFIELRNIDWTAHTYDYWVNGSLIKAGIPFRPRSFTYSNQITRLHLYNSAGEGEAWWDEIRVLDHDEAWMSAPASTLTLAPGASSTIDVTGSAVGQRPGVYKARLDLRSNDPVKPLLGVPVTMTVTPHANVAPVAASQTVNTDEDVPVTITLGGTDADNNSLQFVLKSLPAKGVLRTTTPDHTVITKDWLGLSLGSGVSTLLYEPAANSSGAPIASFTFVAKDYRLESKTATIKINVTSLPDAPKVVDDRLDLDTPTVQPKINVLANDSDGDGDKLTVTTVTQPQRGTVSINADSTLRYEPAATFVSGEDSFTYTASDGTGLSTTGTVSVHLGAMTGASWPTFAGNNGRTNYSPGRLFGRVPVQTWTRAFGTGTRSASVTDRVVVTRCDATTAATTCTALDLPTGAVIWTRQLPACKAITIPSIFSAQVFVELVLNDSSRNEVRCLSMVDGSDVWSAPLPFSSAINTALAVTDQSVFVTLHSVAVTDEALMRVLDRANGSTRFDLMGRQSAPSSIAPCVSGNDVLQVSASQAHLWDATTGEIQRSVSATGAFGSHQSIAAPGGLIFQNSSSLYWLEMNRSSTSPVPSSKGITFSATTSSATPTVAVAGGQVYALIYPASIGSFNLATNKQVGTYARPSYSCFGSPLITDDTLIWSASSSSSGGNATILFDLVKGTQTVLPTVGSWACGPGHLVCTTDNGTVQGYRVFDANAAGGVSAVAQTITTDEDTPVTVTLAATPDGPGLRRIVTELPAHGALYQTSDGMTVGAAIDAVPAAVSHSDGKVIYQPAADATSTERFAFAISDSLRLSAPATVTIQITPVQDAPRAKDDLVVVEPGTPRSITVLDNDFEPDGEVMRITAFMPPASGITVTQVNDTTLSVTAAAGTEGQFFDFSYTASDPQNATSTATVHVTVEGAIKSSWPMSGNTAANMRYYPGSLGTGTLRELWRYDATNSIAGDCASVILAEGKVFVTTNQAEVSSSLPMQITALEMRSGGEVWRSSTAALPYGVWTPAYHRGRLFLASNLRSDVYYQPNTVIAALTAADGSLAWRSRIFHRPDLNVQGSTVASDIGIFTAGSSGETDGLISVATGSGAERFVRNETVSNSWYAMPSLWMGRLFCTESSGVLSERNPDTGMALWSANGGSSYVKPPVIAGGKAIQNNGNDVWAIDLATHQRSWIANGNYAYRPLCASPTRLYVGDGVDYNLGKLRIKVYELATGALLDTLLIPSALDANTMVVTQDSLIVGRSDGLYVVNLATKAVSPALTVPGAPSSLAIANDMLVAAYPGNSVRAYQIPPSANLVPVASAQTLSVVEENNLPVTLSASDGDGNALTYVVRSLPPTGQLYQTTDGITKGERIAFVPAVVKDANHRVIYDTAPDVFGNGRGTFTFTASDDWSTSSSAAITINVTPVNDPPMTMPDVFTARPGETLSGLHPESNDTDADGDTLTITAVTQPAHGSITLVAGAVSYTPDNAFTSGSDAFTYTITDAGGVNVTETCTLRMVPRTGAEWPMSGGPEGNGSGFQAVQLAGTTPLTLAWQAKLESAAGADFVVADGFIYYSLASGGGSIVALDAASGAEMWRTQLSPTRLLGAPIVYNHQVIVAGPEYPATNLSRLDSRTGTVLSQPSLGGVTAITQPLCADALGVCGVALNLGSANYGVFQQSHDGASTFFQPESNFAAFWAPTLSDGRLISCKAGVFREHSRTTGATLWSNDLTFDGSNTSVKPVGSGRYACVLNPSAPLPGDSGRHLAVFDMVNRTQLWSLRQSGFNGTPAMAYRSIFVIAGSYTIQRYDIATGLLQRSYDWGTGNYLTAQQPTITNDSIVVTDGSSLTKVFDLATGVVRQTIPYGGQVRVVGRGLLIRSPDGWLRSFTLPDAFNASPTVAAQTVSTLEDTPVAITLQGNDADGDVITLVVTSLPVQGYLFLTTDGQTRGAQISTVPARMPDGKLLFVPPLDRNGPAAATFSYVASDQSSSSAPAAITINITPQNDAPQATNDLRWAALGETLSPLNERANDYDPDGDALTLVSFTQPAAGIVVQNADGTLRYTAPSVAPSTSPTFTYTVADLSGAQSTAIVTVQISPSRGLWSTSGHDQQHTGVVDETLGDAPFELGWTIANYGQAQPVIADGRVYLSRTASSGNTVRAVNSLSGVTLWEKALTSGDIQPISYHNGGLFFYLKSYYTPSLVAMSAADGATQWTKSVPIDPGGASGFLAPCITDDGVFTVAGYNPCQLQRYGFDGTLKVLANISADRSWQPCVTGNLVLGLPRIGLSAWDKTSGIQRWTVAPVSQGSYGSQFAVWKNNAVFRTDATSEIVATLFCVDINTHLMRWSVTGTEFGVPAVDQGLVFVFEGSSYPVLRVRSIIDGSIVRELTMPAANWWEGFQSQPIVTNDRIIVGRGTKTYILDRTTGAVLQTISTAGGPAALAGGLLVITDSTTAYGFIQKPAIAMSPASGSFGSPVPVVLTATDTSATIRYTTDGSAPTLASPSIASGGTVLMDHTGKLRAIAVNGSNVSRICEGSYTIGAAAARFAASLTSAPPPALASVDSDHDGQSDAAEALAGTNANDAADVLRTRGCETLADGQHVRISWAAKAGHNYVVECSSDLKTWSAVSATLPSTTATMQFDAPVSGPRCFLRVRLVP